MLMFMTASFQHIAKKYLVAKTNNPGKQFIVFSQNHDQTGNRMLGERSSVLVSRDMYKLMAAAVMVSSLFAHVIHGRRMGRNKSVFFFFISHTDKELAALVNKGRKEEFSYFNWQGVPLTQDLKTLLIAPCYIGKN